MIVYIGNKLSRHGSSINFIELLVPRLEDRYQVLSASSNKSKIARIFSMLLLIWMNRTRCRLVIIDTYSTSAFYYAYYAAKLCDYLSLPYVPVLHGGSLPKRFETDRRRCAWFLSKAMNIVSPSLYLYDYFSREGFKLRFIPNFIEIQNYSFKKRMRTLPRILWVRAFHQIYNPTLAVQTLKILNSKFPCAHLCMVGADKDGSLSEVVDLIKEYGLSEKITITGILRKAEWIELSKDYDVFINTTNVDNMPVSVIEAMALGMPIVSTNVGGIPFLIEDKKEGLLTSSGDANSMALAIEQLIEDPTYAQSLSENARRKVEAFDWDVVKPKWFELIDSASV